MSTSIRICSYLLLPLIYLLVNVKIAQLGESFPITIVTFLPVLLQHLFFTDGFTTGFLQHFPRRIAMGGDHRHANR